MRIASFYLHSVVKNYVSFRLRFYWFGFGIETELHARYYIRHAKCNMLQNQCEISHARQHGKNTKQDGVIAPTTIWCAAKDPSNPCVMSCTDCDGATIVMRCTWLQCEQSVKSAQPSAQLLSTGTTHWVIQDGIAGKPLALGLTAYEERVNPSWVCLLKGPFGGHAQAYVLWRTRLSLFKELDMKLSFDWQPSDQWGYEHHWFSYPLRADNIAFYWRASA